MAGGIFADQVFHPNIKCIIISIVIMIFYWTLPYRNPFMLPVIFLVSYIAVAWYDYLYDCDLKMYSGTSPSAMLTSWGKPQRRFERGFEKKGGPSNLVKNKESVYKKKIYALHAIIIAPLLAYIGWRGKKANNNIWSVIGSVALLALLYHGLRIFYPRDVTSCEEENKQERNTLLIIYFFHVIVVVPLLAYIAYYQRRADSRVWGPLLGLAFVLFTYNTMRYFYPRTIKENC